MCMGVPARLVAVDGIAGRAEDGQLIDLKRRSLVAAGLAATAALEAAFAEQLSGGKEMKFFV